MNNFKVGDRVKRIANEFPEILIGSEWVVSEAWEGSNTIAVEGLPNYWTSDNFKLVLENEQDVKTYNPLVAQEGGGHYKNRGIQPIEYSEANNLGACQHSIVKYITRHQEKNGIEDLSKIIHFTFLEAFFKYGEQGSTELKEKVLKLLGVTE